MGRTIVIKGRPAMGGVAEGYAMVCPNSIQGWAGIDPLTGKILEKGHVHEGECYDGKILVLPCSRGSCGWSCQFHGPLDNAGIRPAGWVVTKTDAPVVGATKLDHIDGAAKAVELALSDGELAYLEELYIPHKLVGVMAQNTAASSKEKHVWSTGNQTI